MKKLISVLTVLCLAACLSLTALAAIYSDTQMALDDWETSSYPDYVSCVCYDDDLLVILVNDQEGADLLLSMIAQAPTVIVDTEAPSYNTLLSAMEEISVLLEDSTTVSYGLGWYTDETTGEVTGFGTTGLEFRVILDISTTDDDTEALIDRILEQYGDLVYLQAGLLTEAMTIDLDDEEELTDYVEEDGVAVSLTEDAVDSEASTAETAWQRITSMSLAEWVVALFLLGGCSLSWYMMQKKQ